MSKSEEHATSGRGWSIFPRSWGVPPTTDRETPEFRSWVKDSVLEHELGQAGSVRLQELRAERSKLAAAVRLAELEDKRFGP